MGRPDLTRVSPCSQRGSVRKLPSRALLPLGMALLVVQGCGGDSSNKSSNAKDLSSFAFEASKNSGLAADAAGTITDTSIAVTLPSGTVVTSLTPTIAVSANASVSPASDAAQDFTSPVTYTVTAQDGSTKVFTVTVTVGASASAKDITQFTILAVDGTISDTSIAVTVPGGTVLTSLTPTITITGASVDPASGAAQDFTNPVTYTVTAVDGSTKAYTVTVTTADAKDITQFTISGIDGVIGGSHIAVSLPSGPVDSLTPTIAVSAGASVSPDTGVAQDFTSPVTYTVTAADSSTKTYTVTVTAGATSKNMTLFSILGVDACASGCVGTLVTGGGGGSGTITLTLPSGTDLTSLTPSIGLTSGATADPASGVARDFTSQVTYSVTNPDASSQTPKTWNVTVTAP